MYCINCGVKLADSEVRCPLCETVVYHPELSRPEGERLYPSGKRPAPRAAAWGVMTVLTVLFVLPAFLVLGDSIIERTSFKLKGIETKTRTATGTVRVQGHVRGYISGMVDADFDGVLHGQLNASVSTDGQITVEGDAENE